MTNQVQGIAFKNLVLSQENMRKVRKERPDLINNIAEEGVLQNLLVCVEVDADGKETGRFEVHGGGERLEAVGFLVASKLKTHKKFTKEYELPCLVRPRSKLISDSLAENYCRLAPHPADTYEQFRKLAETGESDEGIALRFGLQSPVIVTRTLKLAKVSPRIFQAFREDKLTYQHMVAYSITDDHAAQEAIFDGGQHPYAHDIKRALTKGTVSLTDKRVKFVGEEAYTGAGGHVIRDLFESHGGYITDVALLNELVEEKMKANQAEVLAEGWLWVEAQADFYHDTNSSTFKTIYPQRLPLAPEVEARIAALEAECVALSDGEWDEDSDQRIEAVEAELDELRSTAQEAYDPEELALAGAMLSLDHSGEIKVQRGLVRAGEKSKLTALKRARQVATPVGDGEAAGEAQAPAKGALSAALMEDLTAQLTMGVRAALIQDPDTALRVTVQMLLAQTMWPGIESNTFVSQARFQDHYASLDRFGSSIKESIAAQAIRAAVAQVKGRLPAKRDGLWDFLLTCDRDELVALNAIAIQATVLCVTPNATMGTATAQVVKATGLDMADYYTPGRDDYFGRVSKDQVLADMGEFATEEQVAQARPMKKGDLASEAASRVEGTRWVPAALRAPEIIETASQRIARAAAELGLGQSAGSKDQAEGDGEAAFDQAA